MEEKNIVFRIEAITNQDVVDEFGETLDKLFGTYDKNIEKLKEYDATIKALNDKKKKEGDLSEAEVKFLREEQAKRSQVLQVLRNEEKIRTTANGSMAQQAQLLGKLRMAWRQMTDEQKKANPQMLASIKALDKAMKGADANIGNFQRNVGNYPQLMSQIQQQLQTTLPIQGQFAQGLMGMAEGAGLSTTALGGLGIAIGAVCAAFKLLNELSEDYNNAVDGSMSLTWQMREANIALTATQAAQTRALQSSAGAWVTLKAAADLGWNELKFELKEIALMMLGLPGIALATYTRVRKMIELPETAKIAKELTDLQKAYEKFITGFDENTGTMNEDMAARIRIANLDNQIAEDRLIAWDKEKYTVEERQTALKRLTQNIKARWDIERQIAQYEYDIAVKEGELSDNSFEANQKILSAKEKLLSVDKQQANQLRELKEKEGEVARAIRARVEAEEKAKAERVEAEEKAKAERGVKIQTVADKAITEAQKKEWKEQEDAYKVHNANMKREQESFIEGMLEDWALAEAETMAMIESDAKNGVLGEKGTTRIARWLGVTDEEAEEITASALNLVSSVFGNANELAMQATQQRLNHELAAIEREAESEKAILKAKLDKNIISQEQYEERMAEIDAETEARQLEAQKAAFEKEKAWNIANALMNTALAVTNIWATNHGGPIARAIETAAAVASCAAQIAIISTQKFAYARGGELHGPSHAQGGIKGSVQGHNIELEGDEVVINKRSARRYRRLLSWINSSNGWGVDFAGVRGSGYTPALTSTFAYGGVLSANNFAPAPLTESGGVVEAVRSQMGLIEGAISAINRRIDRLQVFVSLNDIQSATNTKRVHVGRATL